MALASDLQGLGVPPLLSSKLAGGGTGPLTILPAGTTYATSKELGVTQFLVTTASGAASVAATAVIGLPTIGGDTGCLLGDAFVINNSFGTSSIQIIASTSVLISGQGSLSSKQSLQLHATAILYPVQATLATTTANWVMVAGN